MKKNSNHPKSKELDALDLVVAEYWCDLHAEFKKDPHFGPPGDSQNYTAWLETLTPERRQEYYDHRDRCGAILDKINEVNARRIAIILPKE